MLLRRTILFPTQDKGKHENETLKQKNDPSILSLPSVVSLSLFFLSLVLMLADTAGWKEINLRTHEIYFLRVKSVT